MTSPKLDFFAILLIPLTLQAVHVFQPRIGFRWIGTFVIVMAACLFYIDNLRIMLTILVILHHLAIVYGGSGGGVAYVEEGEMGEVSSILMTLFMAINQAYFMGFFFMISSYFGPGSVDRKGAGPYLKDRLKRLGIPLLFYMVVISPLLEYRVALYYGFQGSLRKFLSQYLKASVRSPG